MRGSGFQSTLPVWGGTAGSPITPGTNAISIHPPRVGRDGRTCCRSLRRGEFQSTLPVWGGTSVSSAQRWTPSISIHPPRVGRDLGKPVLPALHPISIHPPRVGRDSVSESNRKEGDTFQSTLPVWGGTIGPPTSSQSLSFQSTLPVWGGTIASMTYWREPKFQSTLPVWGGTRERLPSGATL